jgi:hypothetical protein
MNDQAAAIVILIMSIIALWAAEKGKGYHG